MTTSVTNMDLHDISRSCRSFGIERYFVVTPLSMQQNLLERILNHWSQEKSSDYNPDRWEAMKLIQVLPDLDAVVNDVKSQTGSQPLVTVTGANFKEDDGPEEELITRALVDERPILLLFGTGWGLSDQVVSSADFKLSPLRGRATDGYNHLSVRSAVAIYLDHFAQCLQRN